MQNHSIKHGEGNKVYLIILCFLFLFIPLFTNAAILELKTAGVDINGYLKLSVIANTSQSAPFNAASALISYPSDIVEVVSVDLSDSIFPLWQSEPEATNGLLSFSGGTPAEGGFIFDGEIMSMYLNIKNGNSGEIRFENAELLASDGVGTNILSNTFDYNFKKVDAIPSTFDTSGDGVVSLTELSIGLVENGI